jgi:hypothetical protein
MSSGDRVVSCGRRDRLDQADGRPEDDHLVAETCSHTSIEHNKLVFFMVIDICTLTDRSRA